MHTHYTETRRKGSIDQKFLKFADVYVSYSVDRPLHGLAYCQNMCSLLWIM